MVGIAIALGFILVFTLGFSTSWIIWTQRMKNIEYMKRAIENARMQGRLESGRGSDESYPRLTPPRPWKD